MPKSLDNNGLNCVYKLKFLFYGHIQSQEDPSKIDELPC